MISKSILHTPYPCACDGTPALGRKAGARLHSKRISPAQTFQTRLEVHDADKSATYAFYSRALLSAGSVGPAPTQELNILQYILFYVKIHEFLRYILLHVLYRIVAPSPESQLAKRARLVAL